MLRGALFCRCLVLALTVAAPRIDARPAGSPPVPDLPPVGPSAFRRPVVIGWQPGETPAAPEGFIVERFAGGFDNPRWPYVLPNGDVLVAQSRTETMTGFPPEVLKTLTEQGLIGKSANNIILLRETASGVERHVFAEGLRQPFGMALVGDDLYVANTDALLRFDYQPGATRLEGQPERIVTLPSGEHTGDWNNHWTRNVVAAPDGEMLYIKVGSGTNVNEQGTDTRERAAVWEVDPATGEYRLYATGLRNPTGLAFEPVTGDLWTTVNERDGLGEDVPPDYLARVVEGADYGWPWVYYGTYPDPFHATRNPERVAAAQETARVPDLPLGGHAVPLGLLFYTGDAFPEKYRRGAFVARRGGVGRSSFLGFDVVFVPFGGGTPTGDIEPFLTGFIADGQAAEVHGRPVGLAMLDDGSLIVTDDAANTIWRVSRAQE